MSRGPARRASFEASRYSAWRWRRPMDLEPAEPRSAVCRGAERTPERPGGRSGAETPNAAGFRSASRFGLPRRKPRFSSASKTGSSRPPKASADSRLRSKVGGEWPRCPPGNPTMKDRRRRGRGISVRFRSGLPIQSPPPKFPGFRSAEPRIMKTCRNHQDSGLFRGRIPELNAQA
jgi:hypothetical protein